MDKPGLSRAIPALIAGFIASLAFVYAVRVLQNMDPVWMNADSSEGAQVGMVLAAFVSMATFMWGVGAFDPKMSEHGDHADEHEEEAPEKEFALRTTGPVFRAGKRLWDYAWYIINDTAKPWAFPYLNVSFFLINWIVNVVWFVIWFAIGFALWRVFLMLVAGIPGTLGALLMTLSCLGQTIAFYAGQLFLVLTIAVITTVVLFTFALLPHGLGLQISTEPNADFFANGFGDFVIPIQDILGLVLPPDDFANQTIAGTSQFTVLLGFILIIFISLALAAGGIAVFFYLAHRGVREVQEYDPTDGERTQIVPIREAGKIAGGVVSVIRAIPRAIGYQK
ncbi:MAG: hypothetical protein OXG53_05265 [Chloroflexi bacterium]|nr:hypothetical protein [Chloroflexota bacterium]